MQFTSVVSYHTNPMTCGVAKFSAELARQLGVPFVGRVDDGGAFPLWSLKASEYPHIPYPLPDRFGVFWHDAGIDAVTRAAEIVFYADTSLGSPGLWCPSLISPRTRPIRLFSFGMAHKLQTARYQRVRDLLYAAKLPYHLRVSVGLHEGTSLDGAEKHFDALKAIMGPEHVTILGILSDDAVAEELAHAEYVLAFFEHGLRANNTTVHAALDAGRVVVSNIDDATPIPLALRVNAINGMDDWFGPLVACDYSWNNLMTEMERVCAASPLTVAR